MFSKVKPFLKFLVTYFSCRNDWSSDRPISFQRRFTGTDSLSLTHCTFLLYMRDFNIIGVCSGSSSRIAVLLIIFRVKCLAANLWSTDNSLCHNLQYTILRMLIFFLIWFFAIYSCNFRQLAAKHPNGKKPRYTSLRTKTAFPISILTSTIPPLRRTTEEWSWVQTDPVFFLSMDDILRHS